MFLSLCVYAIDIKGFREYLGNRILKISELLHMQCNRGRTSYFNFKDVLPMLFISNAKTITHRCPRGTASHYRQRK